MVYCVDEKLNGVDAFMKYRYDFLVLENGFEYLVEPDVWKNTKTAKELMQICKRNFPKVRKMTDLSQSELNQLILKFKEAELNIQHKNIPISVYFNAELSYISIENDEIAAAVLAREIEDADEAVKVIELSAVLCDTGHELLMMESLAKFIGTMDKKYPDYKFRFVTINEKAFHLAEKIFGQNGRLLIRELSRQGNDAVQIMKQVNNVLSRNNENLQFITAFLCLLNIQTGELQYVNAGHEMPFLKRKGQSYEPMKADAGVPLGIMENYEYEKKVMLLGEGDSIFLFTDGVSDCRNEKDELYSVGRVLTTLNGLEGDPIEGMNRQLDDYSGDVEQFDDITMLNIRFKEKRD